MKENKFEDLLNEIEKITVEDESSKMEDTQSDLFDVLMSRCPPSVTVM